MRYFNLTPLAENNAKLLSRLLEYKKIKRGLGVFDVAPKGRSKVFSGKLQAHDIDVIRYLDFISCKKTLIAKSYDVSVSTVSKMITRDTFRKHISPFEDLINNIHPRINIKKAELFYLENKQEIDERISNMKHLQAS